MRKEHGKLIVPVKRRGALVATNPSRNSRPELIRTMGTTWSSGALSGLDGVVVGRLPLQSKLGF
jgi:hypothetical protein